MTLLPLLLVLVQYSYCYTCGGVNESSPSVCSSTPLVQHGICISNNTCNCTANYYGDLCEHSFCYGQPATDGLACGGPAQGVCIDFNTCTCDQQYEGDACEEKVNAALVLLQDNWFFFLLIGLIIFLAMLVLPLMCCERAIGACVKKRSAATAEIHVDNWDIEPNEEELQEMAAVLKEKEDTEAVAAVAVSDDGEEEGDYYDDEEEEEEGEYDESSTD